MREIDNNINNVNFKSIRQKPAAGVSEQASVPDLGQEESKKIDDLKNMPAATLGKSQVAASDSIENDMKYFEKNSEVIEELNHVIEEYAKTHTQEETLKFIDAAINEFSSKK